MHSIQTRILSFIISAYAIVSSKLKLVVAMMLIYAYISIIVLNFLPLYGDVVMFCVS